MSTPTWAAALGKVPSGLFIVTTAETGFLASWIQQCAFDPPQVSIAFSNDRPLLASLEPGSHLCVNVIPEGGKALIGHFGKGIAPGAPAFEGLEIAPAPGGAIILNAALAWLGVSVTAKHVIGDHTLVIAKVEAGDVLTHDHKPTVHTRRDGTRY